MSRRRVGTRCQNFSEVHVRLCSNYVVLPRPRAKIKGLRKEFGFNLNASSWPSFTLFNKTINWKKSWWRSLIPELSSLCSTPMKTCTLCKQSSSLRCSHFGPHVLTPKVTWVYETVRCGLFCSNLWFFVDCSCWGNGYWLLLLNSPAVTVETCVEKFTFGNESSNEKCPACVSSNDGCLR